MATINEQLSEQLMVPEMNSGETRKFQLIKKGQIDTMADDGKAPLKLGVYWQAGKEKIFDGFKKGGKGNKNILILNATGVRMVYDNEKDVNREVPIVEHVYWDETGELLLTEENFETVCFLTRSNKNKNNPFRNKRTMALFYEVNEKLVISTKLFDEEMDLATRQWVWDAKIDEQKAIALNLGWTVDNSKLDGLKVSLLEKARTDPKSIIIASSNIQMKKKVQIMDAEQYGFLIWDAHNRDYYYKDNLNEPFCHIPQDTAKLDGLLAFYTSEKGRAHYIKLAGIVKDLYQAAFN